MIRKQYTQSTSDQHTNDDNSNRVVFENSVDNDEIPFTSSLIQLDFVKSALTINPCMVCYNCSYLQLRISY